MNVKKAIKRIAALAAGTTMVTATIMGAMAYDLGDYPEPFVKNGVFDGKIVVGKTAQVSDVIGAIDVAASLQAAAKTPVDVDGTTNTVSVTGGVEIKSSSEDFNFGDTIKDFNNAEYDSEDFPDLLADGVLEEDDGTEFDYEQTIEVGDIALAYGQDDDYGDEPVFYLDMAGAADAALYFHVEFDDAVNFTELEDSETIKMFGKSYTVDPNHDLGDDLTLYTSDITATVSQDEPTTVEVDGEEYTIEVLGGNTDNSEAIVRVTGDGTETRTMIRGDSNNLAGLDIFIDDIFISNIGEDTISVQVFVGSDKLVIPDNAVSPTVSPSYQEVTIGTEDETDVYAWVEASTSDLGSVEAIHFYVDPTDFDNEATDDEWEWLVMGEEYTDPFFGFSLAFEGMVPGIEGRSVAELTKAGDAYDLKFTNNDGDEYDFELVYADITTTLAFGDDGKFLLGGVTAGGSIEEDQFFILESTDAKVGERTSYIFEVTDIDAVENEVTLKELGSGSSKVYDLTDEIEDTGVSVNTVTAGPPVAFTLTEDTITSLVTDEGMVISWSMNASNEHFNVSFTEDSDDLDEVTVAGALNVTITPDATDDIAMASATGFTDAPDADGDYRYGISDYGTWFEQDTDNDNYLKVYYAGEETDFTVLLNGPEAVVVTSGSSDGVAYNINNFVVGQIAVYDDEAMSLLGSTPVIVVGGPCVNTVAADLMGNPEVCYEGFTDGKAKIKLFESQNALMVAGLSGEDTTGAAQVLAAYDTYDLSGDEVEVITTDLTDLEVNVVE